MNFVFTQPWGWLALLGWPIVVLIHYLRQQPKIDTIHTLFLLQRLAPVEQVGRQLSKWRSSWPFWLQMLMVLLVALGLAQPRWHQKLESFEVVVVLDDSASMSAFRDEVKSWMQKQSQNLQSWRHENTWRVVSSKEPGKIFYQGDRPQAWDLENWKPTAGPHDVGPSLALAKKWIEPNGVVVFVTDHEPQGIEGRWVALGSAKPNVGLYGYHALVDSEKKVWRWNAVIQNTSNVEQTRRWSVQSESGEALEGQSPHELRLEAGQGVAISGELPLEVKRAWVALESDAFALDDRLPMQQPFLEALNLKIFGEPSGASSQALAEILTKVGFVKSVAAQPANLGIAPIGQATDMDAIQYGVAEEGVPSTAAWHLVEKHELTRDLQFAGLITPEPAALSVGKHDQVLVWKGERPLVLLRQDGGRLRLILNWGLNASNFRQDPDLLVLLYRYTELVAKRAGLRVDESVEIDQTGIYPKLTGAQRIVKGEAQAFHGRAPRDLGFFEIQKENGEMAMMGAAQFGEIREATLKDAKTAEQGWANLERELSQKYATQAPPLAWVVVPILLILLASWLLAKPASLGIKTPAVSSAVKEESRV